MNVDIFIKNGEQKKITVKNNKSDEYEKQMMKCKPEDYDLDDEDNFDLFGINSFNFLLQMGIFFFFLIL